MLISKDNRGKTIGWMETYFSGDRTVTVNAIRDVTTISTRDRRTGKVEMKTFFGKPLLPSDSNEK
jgi:hypothetical protein